jgi:hypothetical protein
MEDVNKFYEWLVKIKSIHLADNYRMSKAFDTVYQNSVESIKIEKRCILFI